MGSLESQLRHLIQQRQGLERQIGDEKIKFREARKRERRITESVSAVLDLLADRADEPEAGSGRANAEPDEQVVEMLVAALGENPPE